MDSNEERLGQRDMELSKRLRTIGYTTDVDNLFCDFINARAVAISEYKHCNIEGIKGYLGKPSILAIKRLADASEIPFFLVVYKPPANPHDCWGFNVLGVNERGQKFLLDFGEIADRAPMSEQRFHEMHSRLRGYSESREWSKDNSWVHPELMND